MRRFPGCRNSTTTPLKIRRFSLFIENKKGTEIFSGGKTWCRRGKSNPHQSHPSPDLESGLEAVESLGNIKKHNHLTGLSANLKNEILGRIGNCSGRHLRDRFRGSSPCSARGSRFIRRHRSVKRGLWRREWNSSLLPFHQKGGDSPDSTRSFRYLSGTGKGIRFSQSSSMCTIKGTEAFSRQFATR